MPSPVEVRRADFQDYLDSEDMFSRFSILANGTDHSPGRFGVECDQEIRRVSMPYGARHLGVLDSVIIDFRFDGDLTAQI
jgi:hypothetical protein